MLAVLHRPERRCYSSFEGGGAPPPPSGTGGPEVTTTYSKYIRVGATGDDSGDDWTNAYPAIPASLTRDTTYYIAGGTYAGNVSITTAESGALWVRLRKANATENSGVAGWDASYSTTQTVIQGWILVYYGYVDIDGVTGSGASGHGIKVEGQAGTDQPTILEEAAGTPWAVRHVEVVGAGAIASTADGIKWNIVTGAAKNGYVGYCYIHDTPRCGIVIGTAIGTSYADYGMLAEHNFISEIGLGTVPGSHAQGIQVSYAMVDRYTVFRSNVFRNVVGTGNIVYMGGAGAEHTYSHVYNNVFYYTDLATYGLASPGVVANLYDYTLGSNILVYNNTFYNIGSAAYPDAKPALHNAASAPNTFEGKNNIWVNCHFSAPSVGVTAFANNDYYGCTGPYVPTGEPNQTTETGDPFVNAAAGNFRLVVGCNAKDGGADLSAVYAVDTGGLFDADGTNRPTGVAWDIGAFEYTV